MSSSTKLVRPVIDLCLFFYLFQFFYIQNFFIFIYLFLSSIHISHKCSNQTSEGGGVDLADVAVRKLDKLNNYKLGIIDHKDKYKYKHWSKYTYIPAENKYESNCNKYLGIFLHLSECIHLAFQLIFPFLSCLLLIAQQVVSCSGKIFLVVRYYHCYNWWRFSTIGSTKGDVNITRLSLFGRPPLNQGIISQPLPEPVSIIIIIINNIFNIII